MRDTNSSELDGKMGSSVILIKIFLQLQFEEIPTIRQWLLEVTSWKMSKIDSLKNGVYPNDQHLLQKGILHQVLWGINIWWTTKYWKILKKEPRQKGKNKMGACTFFEEKKLFSKVVKN